MTYDIDAIFDQGVFHPLQPVLIPAGTRVHLSVNQEDALKKSSGRLLSPRLTNPEQAAEFQMEVQENSDAGL